MRAETEQNVRSSAEETEEQLSAVTAERDQLKMDLQENVEMVSYCATALPVLILKCIYFPSAAHGCSCVLFVYARQKKFFLFLFCFYQTDD